MCSEDFDAEVIAFGAYGCKERNVINMAMQVLAALHVERRWQAPEFLYGAGHCELTSHMEVDQQSVSTDSGRPACWVDIRITSDYGRHSTIICISEDCKLKAVRALTCRD